MDLEQPPIKYNMTQRKTGQHAQLASLVTPIRTDEGSLIMLADAVRLSFSLCILSFAAVSCGWAMYAGVTVMSESCPNYVVFIIFFVSLFMLIVAEGLHVAPVQVAYQDHTQFLESHPRAAAIMKYQNQGRNLQHFLIGRQIVVLFSVFLLVQCTSFDAFFDSLPSWIVTYVMHSGFLGVVLVVQIGQLVPQILSSHFPVDYINIHVVSWIYYFCLGVEQTGICHTVWLICWCIDRCGGTQKEKKDNTVEVAPTFEYIAHSDDIDTDKRVSRIRKERVDNRRWNDFNAQMQPLLSVPETKEVTYI